MNRRNRFSSAYSALVFIASLFVPMAVPLVGRAQVRPIYDMGAIGLAQQLERLQTTASVLHTGAHPDDEDSGLLAYLARHDHARTAYLALNRGDGGQNVIGQELFESLGVIRSEELLQARRLDGGSQFFTRVMDYGFSKKRAEAARIWGGEQVLGDMVRAIRLFRPLVIISRFTGTPADGHGQHQLAGYLTPFAFKAAADPTRFPEQLKEGLQPWQALKLYVSQSFVRNPNNPPSLMIDTGTYDPLIGRSYFEIAMEGRSQHKTQEMGTLELRGKRMSGMRVLDEKIGAVANEKDVFDGIDTSITGIAALAQDSAQELIAKLKDLQATAAEAQRSYDPYAPEKLIPILARGYKQAIDAKQATRNPTSKYYLLQKQNEFAKALQMAAGVVVDALSGSETVVAGDPLYVAVRIFAAAGTDVKIVDSELKIPAAWTVTKTNEPAVPQLNPFRSRREDSFGAAFFRVDSPVGAELTQPYWLESPRTNFTYDWSKAGDAKNHPFAAPLITARVKLNIGGEDTVVEKDVEYRYADDIRGEIRREVNVVPALTLGLASNLLIAPKTTKAQKHKLVMTVTNNSPVAAQGTAKFNAPTGWTLTPASANFDLPKSGDKTALTFDVTVPANAKAGSYELDAVASMAGKDYDRSVQTIAYPHIQTHRIYSKAEVSAKVLDLKVAPVKVGYIMGSGDRVPEAIRRLGLGVTLLDEKALSTGNLSQFDTIVVGIRASQVRPDYIANNGRLKEFMSNGGTLIVQYQQQEYARLGLAPYPMKMNGNVRVVDENATVRVLQPQNPVFNFPNKINDNDWLGWVQERDLYCFTEFDTTKYTGLLESHDEGEAESNGGMVYAQVGKGKYVYTAYSWFRQLPVGNAGAYRIFANLLSLPKAK